MKKALLILLCFLPLFVLGQDRYASLNGLGSNNGLSESNAWSWTQALSNATSSHTVHVKAGGNFPRGNPANAAKFVGYKITPGDITAPDYTDAYHIANTLSFTNADMPMIVGTDTDGQYGMIVNGTNAVIENFIFKDLQFGMIVNGVGATVKNIVTISCSRGISVRGNNVTMDGCYALDNDGQGLDFSLNASGGLCVDSQVRSVSVSQQYKPGENPLTGYYFLAGTGANNNVFDNCVAWRIPNDNSSYHQGHGFVGKANSYNNTWKNSRAYNTGIEMNFGDVRNNTLENIKIYGNTTSYPNQFSAGIRVINGAHDNLFKNIYIEDTRYAINLHNFDDGLGGEDLNQGGNNNYFVNIVVNKANNVIASTDQEAGGAATSNGNEFYNCTFDNVVGVPFVDHHIVTNTKFINCSFSNMSSTYEWQQYNGVSKGYTFDTSNFYNLSFTIPTGTAITAHNPLYVGGSGVGKLELQSGSSLINIGKATDYPYDFYNVVRTGNPDIGGFEYTSGGGDVTAPTEVSYTVTNITNVGATFTGWFSENTKARIEWGTTGSYGNLTHKENSFITPHQQIITTAPSSTHIFWRWAELEDEAGNTSNGPTHTFTTLAGPDPEPEAPIWTKGVKSRFLKLNKF